MRKYINDTSLQGQYADVDAVENIFRELLGARARLASLRRELRTTESLGTRLATPAMNLRQVVQGSKDRDFRGSVLGWLDRAGPFISEERQAEQDDYFECLEIDVTDSGLGEAARRAKNFETTLSFSFPGGPVDFSSSPLAVYHGLPEERLGQYAIGNVCEVSTLCDLTLAELPAATSWQSLVETSRQRFPRLMLPDAIFENDALAREPFDTVIRDRATALLGHLNSYITARQPSGADSADSRHILENFFTGDRALFSGESPSNQRQFESELKFPDPENPRLELFCHWHGKISHRYFRLHFEWPVPPTQRQLKVVYLGPKITKG